MSTYGPAYSSSGSSSGDQIVVDVRDIRAIRAELRRMRITTQVLDEIPELKVAMIGLTGLDGLSGLGEAEAVRQRLISRYTDDERYTAAPAPLDVAMTLVRDRFAKKFLRAPRMGKNRDMEVVGGLPHWAAAEMPVPIDPTPEQFELAPADSVEGPGLRVGVLDTAMFDNPVLRDRFTCDDIITDQKTLPTWAGHATFIVGRILRRAPGAKILVRKVLGSQGGKYGTATAWELAQGMASFLGSGVEVLNLSLGCFTVDDEPPFLLQRATEVLLDEMVVVAAAGNHGKKSYPMPALDEKGVPQWRPEPLSPSSPMWPAAIEGVVAVGAAVITGPVDEPEMTPADFTPVDVPWIALWAPGVEVVSTYLDGVATAVLWTWEADGSVSPPFDWSGDFTGYATWSGTSMSAGDVTGEIARLAQDGSGARRAYQQIAARPGGPKGRDDIRPWI